MKHNAIFITDDQQKGFCCLPHVGRWADAVSHINVSVLYAARARVATKFRLALCHKNKPMLQNL
jgi:hypothetical protein